MVVVFLHRAQAAPDDRCGAFLKCLLNRRDYGPPEFWPSEAHERKIDSAISPFPVRFMDAKTSEEGLRLMNDLASECAEDWSTLYSVNPPTS